DLPPPLRECLMRGIHRSFVSASLSRDQKVPVSIHVCTTLRRRTVPYAHTHRKRSLACSMTCLPRPATSRPRIKGLVLSRSLAIALGGHYRCSADWRKLDGDHPYTCRNAALK